MRLRTVAFALLLLLLACAPDPGPTRVAVLRFDPKHGGYRLAEAELHTLTDLPSLTGAAATPIGNATISVTTERLAHATSEATFRSQVLEDEGGPVEVQFVEKDGVLFPIDFHSLNLTTAYFNFEQSRDYALARGMQQGGPLDGVPFYYFPALTLPEPAGESLADNAAWFTLLRSFLLLPFAGLQEIPLAMNLGVIAHEYGHGIFHAEVHRGSWLPSFYGTWCGQTGCSSGFYALQAIEEGLADAWATGVTKNPRYIGHSISQYGDLRDLDAFEVRHHCLDPAQFEGDLARAEADPSFWLLRKYELGTILGAALYRAGQSEGTSFDRVMDAVFLSYAHAPGNFRSIVEGDRSGAELGRLETLASVLLRAAPDAPTARALCAAMLDRFSLTPDALAGLCDGVLRNTQCP